MRHNLNKEKTMLKTIKTVFITALILFALFFLIERFGLMARLFPSSRLISFSSSSIIKDVLPISEYAALTYHYTTVADFEDEAYRQILGRDVRIPGTTKIRKLLYSFDGTMKLGINAANIEIERVGSKIILTMPPIEILSHMIDENSLKVHLDETKGLFTKELSFDEKFKLIENKRKEIERKVLTQDIAKEAKSSAEFQFRAFLQNLPDIKGRYSIEFVWRPAENINPPKESPVKLLR
jgi:hypothetical protein